MREGSELVELPVKVVRRHAFTVVRGFVRLCKQLSVEAGTFCEYPSVGDLEHMLTTPSMPAYTTSTPLARETVRTHAALGRISFSMGTSISRSETRKVPNSARVSAGAYARGRMQDASTASFRKSSRASLLRSQVGIRWAGNGREPASCWVSKKGNTSPSKRGLRANSVGFCVSKSSSAASSIAPFRTEKIDRI